MRCVGVVTEPVASTWASTVSFVACGSVPTCARRAGPDQLPGRGHPSVHRQHRLAKTAMDSHLVMLGDDPGPVFVGEQRVVELR